MNQVCFLIPVYPRDYRFLDFLNELTSDINFDIIFILSYKDDYVLLESLNYNKIYKTMILEDFLPREHIDKLIQNRTIISYKKYCALNRYKDIYKYLATVDSEIRFINTTNIYEKFERFFNNKKMYGGGLNDSDTHKELIYKINHTSSMLFSEKERELLEQRTRHFSFYFWFSDIPVYEANTLKGYLEYISYADDESFSSKLDWHMFDYIPYMYYLNLYHGFTFVNVNDYKIARNWSLEFMPITTHQKIKGILQYEPLWVIENVYNENRELLHDIILVYHRNAGRPINFGD